MTAKHVVVPLLSRALRLQLCGAHLCNRNFLFVRNESQIQYTYPRAGFILSKESQDNFAEIILCSVRDCPLEDAHERCYTSCTGVHCDAPPTHDSVRRFLGLWRILNPHHASVLVHMMMRYRVLSFPMFHANRMII